MGIFNESKNIEKLIKLTNKVEELEKQNESLKSLLEVKKTIPSGTVPETVSSNQELTELRIEEMVDNMLANENINIKYLPDFVEKAIYKNVLNLTINLMESMLKNANITFMGHQVTFELKPIPSVPIAVPV